MLTMKWSDARDGEFHDDPRVGDIYAQYYADGEKCGEPVRFMLQGAPELAPVEFPDRTLMLPCRKSNDGLFKTPVERTFSVAWLDGEDFLRESTMLVVDRDLSTHAWFSPFSMFTAGMVKSNQHGDFRYNAVQDGTAWFKVEDFPLTLAITPKGDMYVLDEKSNIVCMYRSPKGKSLFGSVITTYYRAVYKLRKLLYRIRGIDVNRRD